MSNFEDQVEPAPAEELPRNYWGVIFGDCSRKLSDSYDCLCWLEQQIVAYKLVYIGVLIYFVVCQSTEKVVILVSATNLLSHCKVVIDESSVCKKYVSYEAVELIIYLMAIGMCSYN
jgi:hypothetical protein